jgi:hypothetical protein
MRWIIPTVLIVAVVLAGWFGIRDQLRTRKVMPLPVPEGDHEIAWIHTSTNPQTWERFVAGIRQTQKQLPDLQVDDSRAFLDQSASIPEVVIWMEGKGGKLRFRWYKQSGEVGTRDWVRMLAARDPVPIAFLGGGSSDRAVELARAMDEQSDWNGKKPLLLFMTATANEVYNTETFRSERLMDVYPERSFRFCFTNAAMARGVLEFVWQSEDLRPRGPVAPTASLSFLGALSPWNAVSMIDAIRTETPPRAFVLAWQDDPYSIDLAEQFHHLFHEGGRQGHTRAIAEFRNIPYSVGTYHTINSREVSIAEEILSEVPTQSGQRMLMVLPAATQPARRILRTFVRDSPLIGKQLVAVTGDGISFNTLYRDQDVAWPIRELAIPIVFFAHQNPVAWTENENDPASDALRPPNSTDDVLLFAEMVNVLTRASYAKTWVGDSDVLATRLKQLDPPFFDTNGERLSGKGEYVIAVRPQFVADRVARNAIYDIYTRRESKEWELVRRLFK